MKQRDRALKTFLKIRHILNQHKLSTPEKTISAYRENRPTAHYQSMLNINLFLQEQRFGPLMKA